MTRFILEINLGNEAMQAPGDIATALKNVAHVVNYSSDMHILNTTIGTIRDINGNVVGHYEVI